MAQNSEISLENSSEKHHFVYCFRPIYYFVRLSGKMPFTFIWNANKTVIKAKFYVRDLIWSAISLFQNMSLIYKSIQELTDISQPNTKLLEPILGSGGRLILFMTALLGFSAMVLDMCNCFNFIQILNEITHLDREVMYSCIHFHFDFFLIVFFIWLGRVFKIGRWLDSVSNPNINSQIDTPGTIPPLWC